MVALSQMPLWALEEVEGRFEPRILEVDGMVNGSLPPQTRAMKEELDSPCLPELS